MTVALPSLGTVSVSATIGLAVVNGVIVGTLSALEADGLALPEALFPAARQALTITIDLSDLPFHASATSVRVNGSTVTISGFARDVVLRTSG